MEHSDEMRKRASPDSLEEDEPHTEEKSNTIIAANDSDDTSFWSPVVACILVTETAERFSYFGFRAILVLYFTRVLQYDEPTAIALFAYTTCLAYLSPLFGALLADGHLGRYTTILWFGAIYSAGLIILTTGACMESSEDGENLPMKRSLTFFGLFLVCLGTGGIKPCVSAFGADQVAYAAATPEASNNAVITDDKSNGHHAMGSHLGETVIAVETSSEAPVTVGNSEARVRAFFAAFYFVINLGAVSSIFIVPILRAHFGFGPAFMAPTLFILFAMAAFLSKRHEYINHMPGQDGTSLATTFRFCWWLLRKRLSAYPIVMRCMPCIRPTGSPAMTTNARESSYSTVNTDEVDVQTQPASPAPINEDIQLRDAAQALHVLPIMSLFPIFWMLYDQQGSVWTLQASRMALHGLQPEQLNVVNPVEIMIFIPLFDRMIYPALESWGWNISHLRRMAWGMLLASLSFFISGIVERTIQYREANGLDQIHVLWQLPQLTILAVAEIFLSVTGLEFAYATSPDRLKAFLMALYLLTTAVGDFFGGILYSSVFQALNMATVLNICAVLMLANLGLFCFVAHWWEQSEAPYSPANEDGTLDSTKRSISMEFEDYESLGRTTSFKGVEMKAPAAKVGVAT